MVVYIKTLSVAERACVLGEILLLKNILYTLREMYVAIHRRVKQTIRNSLSHYSNERIKKF